MKTSNINKDIKKLLIWAIVISLLFVVGIPLIIVGATNSIWALLGIGIACTVIGFYGTPMIWVGYSNKRTLKHVVDAVMEDHLTRVAEIASQLQMSEGEVKAHIYLGIKNKYILGYVFDGSVLTPNQKEAPKKKIIANKCPNCGGVLKVSSGGYDCPYCDSHFDKEG